MRNTTQIKEIANQLQERIQDDREIGIELFGEVRKGLDEIIKIATEMDARTGTIDPSLKKE